MNKDNLKISLSFDFFNKLKKLLSEVCSNSKSSKLFKSKLSSFYNKLLYLNEYKSFETKFIFSLIKSKYKLINSLKDNNLLLLPLYFKNTLLTLSSFS